MSQRNAGDAEADGGRAGSAGFDPARHVQRGFAVAGLISVAGAAVATLLTAEGGGPATALAVASTTLLFCAGIGQAELSRIEAAKRRLDDQFYWLALASREAAPPAPPAASAAAAEVAGLKNAEALAASLEASILRFERAAATAARLAQLAFALGERADALAKAAGTLAAAEPAGAAGTEGWTSALAGLREGAHELSRRVGEMAITAQAQHEIAEVSLVQAETLERLMAGRQAGALAGLADRLPELAGSLDRIAAMPPELERI